jgi:hypothetical protein
MAVRTEKLLDEAITNIRKDRELTHEFIDELRQEIYSNKTAHHMVGQTLGKYLENLQRSNEQLVKLVALHTKKDGKPDSLSKGEIDNLYDAINGKDE